MDALNKLSGVDSDTVKKLQDLLSSAIENNTTKQQQQSSTRSVWDRIAPSESNPENESSKPVGSIKGRFIKETGSKETSVVTSTVHDVLPPAPPPGSKSKKYHNLQPLEPDREPAPKSERLKMTNSVVQKPNTAPYMKLGPNRFTGTFRKDSGPQGNCY